LRVRVKTESGEEGWERRWKRLGDRKYYRRAQKYFTQQLINFLPKRKVHFGASKLGPVKPFGNGRKWPSPTGRPGTGASSTLAVVDPRRDGQQAATQPCGEGEVVVVDP
jgi:hypothetical protein